VLDTTSGIASFQGRLDDAAFAPVTLKDGGFSFMTNATADGNHEVQLKATDNAGNVRTVVIDFTLDTSRPVINVTSPVGNFVLSSSVPVAGQVTDAAASLSTMTAKVDTGPVLPVTLGPGGSFGFTLALSEGAHVVLLSATD